MKHLRKFDSVSDMNTTLANSTIGILGVAYEGGSAVIKSVTPPPAPVTKYTITTVVNPAGAGVVSGDEGTFSPEQTATLTATPNEGYEFYRWRDASGYHTENPYSFSVTDNVNIRAYFRSAETRYNVTVTNGTPGSEAYVTITGAGQKVEGVPFTLSATYTTPYIGCHWYLDGVEVASTDDYTYRNIQRDLDFVVYFDYNPQDRTITVASNNPSYGTVQIESSWYHTTSNTSLVIVEVLDEAKLTATPNTGYQFEGWYYNNEKVSSDAVYTFTLPEWSTDRTYTANFINTQA
jgi:uncharacterized repeat protein (TIGR02543 family)